MHGAGNVEHICVGGPSLGGLTCICLPSSFDGSENGGVSSTGTFGISSAMTNVQKLCSSVGTSSRLAAIFIWPLVAASDPTVHISLSTCLEYSGHLDVLEADASQADTVGISAPPACVPPPPHFISTLA